MSKPWTRTFHAGTIAVILGVPVRRVRYWKAQGLLADYTPEAVAAFLRTYTDWRGRLPR